MSLITQKTERSASPGTPARIMRIRLLGITIWSKEVVGRDLIYRLLGLPVFCTDAASATEWC